MNIFLSSVSGLFSGIFGAMGLGGGGILIIYLTVFGGLEQFTAQGINLIFFTFMALTSVIIQSYKKLIDWKSIMSLVLLGIPGAMIGFYFSSLVNPPILSKLFGMLMLAIGIFQFLKTNE